MSGEIPGFDPTSSENGGQIGGIEGIEGASEGKEVQKEPLWREKVLEGMSQEDQEAVRRIRSFFEEKGTPQEWYYAGAGGDISPTLIAPSDTEHWWVDPSYEAGNRLYLVTRPNIKLEEDIPGPYEALGASIQTEVPWDQVWERGRQTLHIDGRTTIEMVGGVTQDKETVPQEIDVIYTNPFSTSPGPDVLINLKKGGYYISVTVGRSSPQLDMRLFERVSDDDESRRYNLGDLGG